MIMRKAISRTTLNLPLRERATMAFKEAVQDVIEEHVQKNLPIYILRDGKVTDALPEMKEKLSRNGKKRNGKRKAA